MVVNRDRTAGVVCNCFFAEAGLAAGHRPQSGFQTVFPNQCSLTNAPWSVFNFIQS